MPADSHLRSLSGAIAPASPAVDQHYGLRLQRQKGVFLVLVALAMLVIMGFVGLAVDTGRMLVARGELQNAADACALAASLELNGGVNAPQRGSLAGRFTASKNFRNFQSGSVSIAAADVTFSKTLNGTYLAAGAASSDARFVRCVARESGWQHFFLSAVGVQTSQLAVSALGTVQPAQSTCALPMGICANSMTAPYGMHVGSRYDVTATAGSFFRWINYTGPVSPTVGDLATAFNAFGGVCDLKTATTPLQCLGIKEGEVTTLVDSWNERFGMYQNSVANTISSSSPPPSVPDLTGYASWTDASATGGLYSSYRNTWAPGRLAFDPNQTDLNFNAYRFEQSWLRQYGSSGRRVAPVAIVDCGNSAGTCSGSSKLLGWACILMLTPKVGNSAASKFWIEYLGDASDLDSPCRTAGVPGGTATNGPLVPVLVQ